MIPKRMTLENFLSFGEPADEFAFTDDEPLWVLCGPNGVGKSAVFDAITYALYGEHRGGRRKAEQLIRHGANGFRSRSSSSSPAPTTASPAPGRPDDPGGRAAGRPGGRLAGAERERRGRRDRLGRERTSAWRSTRSRRRSCCGRARPTRS